MNELETLPKGWVHSTLGEVCEPSQYGYTAKAGSEGNYHFLRTTDITKSSLDWDNVPFCTLADNEAEKYVLKDGDIVISRAGSIGYSSLIQNPRKSVFASYLIRFRPLIDNKYLNYFLATPAYWQSISEGSSGIAVQNVNAKTLSAIKLPLAPKNEQTRVVEKLEELLSDLDNGVAELKTAQIKLTQYRQTLLKSAVEGSLTAEWRTKNQPTETGEQLLQRILKERRQRWEQQKLADFEEKGKKPPKDWKLKYPEPVQPDISELPELPEGWVWASVAQVSSDEPYSLAIGPFGSNLKVSDYTNSGVPLVFVRNIRSGNYGGDFTKFVSEEKASELTAHSVSVGDVLITKMGEPPGDADVFPSNQPDSIITADCIKVRCWSELIIPEFLKSAINSWIGKKQILPITKGVAQKKVSLGRFASLAIPIPPFEEQKEIIYKILHRQDEVNRELKATLLGIKQAEVQRKNILKDAFSGKLVSQDPSDEPASVQLEKIKAERVAQAKLPKPNRTKKKANNKAIIMDTLSKVLKANGDWMDAQEAFTACGVTEGTDTDRIEELYAELRKLDKAQKLLCERHGDYDMIKLKDE